MKGNGPGIQFKPVDERALILGLNSGDAPGHFASPAMKGIEDGVSLPKGKQPFLQGFEDPDRLAADPAEAFSDLGEVQGKTAVRTCGILHDVLKHPGLGFQLLGALQEVLNLLSLGDRLPALPCQVLGQFIEPPAAELDAEIEADDVFQLVGFIKDDRIVFGQDLRHGLLSQGQVRKEEMVIHHHDLCWAASTRIR